MRNFRRILSGLVLLAAVCSALTSCASLFGVTRNYRSDGLAVLDVRVIGPAACGGCVRVAPHITSGVEKASVTIRGPARAVRMDTLTVLTDVHGQALFEGVPPGRYTLEIEPPPGFTRSAARPVDLAANAKRTIKHRLGGLVSRPESISGRR
jgi:hypothetical protein